jgi:hypothetical protein
MGHARLESTYWYLENTPQLMAEIAEKLGNNINSNKTNDMKNNELPEGESDNPKGDPDDETSGEGTLETDGGGEALEGTSDPSKNEP